MPIFEEDFLVVPQQEGKEKKPDKPPEAPKNDIFDVLGKPDPARIAEALKPRNLDITDLRDRLTPKKPTKEEADAAALESRQKGKAVEAEGDIARLRAALDKSKTVVPDLNEKIKVLEGNKPATYELGVKLFDDLSKINKTLSHEPSVPKPTMEERQKYGSSRVGTNSELAEKIATYDKQVVAIKQGDKEFFLNQTEDVGGQPVARKEIIATNEQYLKELSGLKSEVTKITSDVKAYKDILRGMVTSEDPQYVEAKKIIPADLIEG